MTKAEDRKEYFRKYYLKNKKKMVSYAKKYYQDNIEQEKQRRREWVAKNPDKKRDINARYCARNRAINQLRNQARAKQISWSELVPVETSRKLGVNPETGRKLKRFERTTG